MTENDRKWGNMTQNDTSNDWKWLKMETYLKNWKWSQKDSKWSAITRNDEMNYERKWQKKGKIQKMTQGTQDTF